jgi:predicted RNA polymerase sigma factor
VTWKRVDLSLAEELVQEAFEQALAHWPSEGLPPSPEGWIITTDGQVDNFRVYGRALTASEVQALFASQL